MKQIPQLSDPGEIARLVTERVEAERIKKKPNREHVSPSRKSEFPVNSIRSWVIWRLEWCDSMALISYRQIHLTQMRDKCQEIFREFQRLFPLFQRQPLLL